MKIFISGASGLVGGNCLTYLQSKGWEVVGSHRTFPTDNTVFFDTLDLSSKRNFDLLKFRPDVIIHCGALTHVDYCEEHPDESFEKNVVATQQLLNLAKQCQATFVFLSSDYVFDGKSGPYQETDEPNPLNVYGQHKLNAEDIIQNECSDFLILRVTNVYGREIRQKNFIARILRQIEKKEPIHLKLPYDQFATPVNAWDIARAIHLLIDDKKTGIYHIASSDFMNRVTLAKRVMQAFPESDYRIESISTDNLAQPALRPLLGGLINAKFLAEFPDFLFATVDDYLREILG